MKMTRMEKESLILVHKISLQINKGAAEHTMLNVLCEEAYNKTTLPEDIYEILSRLYEIKGAINQND